MVKIEVTLSDAEWRRISARHPTALTPSGTPDEALRQALGLSERPLNDKKDSDWQEIERQPRKS